MYVCDGLCYFTDPRRVDCRGHGAALGRAVQALVCAGEPSGGVGWALKS
jgi:hypothetical protein